MLWLCPLFMTVNLNFNQMRCSMIIISGAGIGGLSAALSLANNGFQVKVLEKAAVLGEVGAGIQLGPNAFHCFDALGVGDKARAMAIYVDRLRLMDAMTADEICNIPLGDDFRAHFGNPYAVIHRGDLHAMLLSKCRETPSISIETAHEVTSYSQDDKGVTTNTGVKGAALIGADGLWSNIRKLVAGDTPARVSGHTTYRSVIPLEQMPEDLRWNAATLWAGPKCHIVHYPLQGWKTFNLVVTYHNNAPDPVAGEAVTHEEVLKGFQHVHPKARQIIEIGKDWRRWVLCDRDPIQNWVDGRVALLGDAAHPMMQYMAQGACMAMEDGVTLGKILKDNAIETGLKLYNQTRATRTARVQLMSREIGNYVYHPAGATADLRNEIMGKKTPAEWNAVLDWIYGVRV
jgi:3-hydroxybenzoate 6-monooxygenase